MRRNPHLTHPHLARTRHAGAALLLVAALSACTLPETAPAPLADPRPDDAQATQAFTEALGRPLRENGYVRALAMQGIPQTRLNSTDPPEIRGSGGWAAQNLRVDPRITVFWVTAYRIQAPNGEAALAACLKHLRNDRCAERVMDATHASLARQGDHWTLVLAKLSSQLSL